MAGFHGVRNIMFRSVVKKALVCVLLVPLFAHSQNNTEYLPPEFTDKNRLEQIKSVFPLLNTLYQEYAKKNHFPGYAFGVILDGKMVYFGSGGYANLKEKTPVNTHTMFRIASMTKSFTAMAVLKLRDEGKLKLDDPASLYIPELKNQKLTHDSPEITIRDLLTHSEGFPEDNPWGDRNLDKTDAELIALIKKGISFSNATEVQYEYSNLGFALLGLIIKNISGMPYQDYIAANIWKPLGMSEAAWEFTKIPSQNLARGYKWDQDHWEEEPLLHDGSFGAMGGMITSIESFSQYVALHQAAWPPRNDAETGPLKRGSIREMHQPWRFNTFNAHAKLVGKECATIASYGYGLRWLRDCHEKVYVGHSGGLPGFGSNWVFLPEYDIGVILFANTTYALADPINLNAVNILIKKGHLKPRELPASNILTVRKDALVKLLPEWRDAPNSGLFASNFFLDNSVDALRTETQTAFANAGKITHVGEVIPENQLRGYFMLNGERANLKISFSLSPDNPALIQSFGIEEVALEQMVG